MGFFLLLLFFFYFTFLVAFLSFTGIFVVETTTAMVNLDRIMDICFRCCWFHCFCFGADSPSDSKGNQSTRLSLPLLLETRNGFS